MAALTDAEIAARVADQERAWAERSAERQTINFSRLWDLALAREANAARAWNLSGADPDTRVRWILGNYLVATGLVASRGGDAEHLRRLRDPRMRKGLEATFPWLPMMVRNVPLPILRTVALVGFIAHPPARSDHAAFRALRGGPLRHRLMGVLHATRRARWSRATPRSRTTRTRRARAPGRSTDDPPHDLAPLEAQ